MSKKIFVFLAVFAPLAGGFVSNAFAVAPANYEFNITLEDVVEDVANSGLLGKPDWYQWIYKVDIVPGGSSHNGLSHFTIELEDCFEGELLAAIGSTAGYNGVPSNGDNLNGLDGNEYREYAVSTGNDGSTGIWGIKWDLTSGTFDDVVNDVDYFWFSAPTEETFEGMALVKHAGNIGERDVLTPDCPECEPVIPEPATMLLLGSGLAGAFIRKKFAL